ncbi:MAG: bifunctional phosphopantothenoylcysteine decarboxylase/phosphopantothenate--cysteine ligase CoaBC [Bacteroidales bacterium]|nr:bifunctional phosphopantothenoylcysteine decarboxylase/phosphopantothenate--cysteine ligase CoaBC [Bacteroidales bacterium]
MNILIGITGGIAAYKVAILVRLLVKNGHNVKVIMSPMAKHFVTPLTLATLSKNPILVDFYVPENGDWNSHVDIGLWADAYVIAPATANSLAKMANGIADNLLLTTYLSARCPVFFAPTMDLDMFKHPATQKSIETLVNRGNIKIDATSGELASGLEGKGRMAEPETIFQTLVEYFDQNKKLKGKKALVTAGPTYEHIDPVRFIGNYSSGKMGFAIAEELANQGAEVFLVTGTVNLKTQNPNIKRFDVVSAQQMFEKSMEIFPEIDIAVLSAAVADYRPVSIADSKIKKKSDSLTIELEKTPDIAKNLGEIKKENQTIVGFALETDNEFENAVEKLKKKNFDFIVLNSLKDKGAGFNVDTNKITIVHKNSSVQYFELKSKPEVAKDIVEEICKIKPIK